MNFLFLIFASTVHITSGFDKTFCKCDESINTEGRIMGGEDVILLILNLIIITNNLIENF